MVLAQNVKIVFAPDAEYPVQTLVDVHVLAPWARAVAIAREVRDAAAPPSSECPHGVPREHLQWAMQAIPAIIDKRAGWCLGVVAQGRTESGRQEYAVRIHLRCPAVELEAPLSNDLAPDAQKDWRVQSRVELAP